MKKVLSFKTKIIIAICFAFIMGFSSMGWSADEATGYMRGIEFKAYNQGYISSAANFTNILASCNNKFNSKTNKNEFNICVKGKVALDILNGFNKWKLEEAKNIEPKKVKKK